ncbi:MAG: hypothetical protein ACFFD4_26340 [Candidatus Odinarchaeota archaeon]
MTEPEMSEGIKGLKGLLLDLCNLFFSNKEIDKIGVCNRTNGELAGKLFEKLKTIPGDEILSRISKSGEEERLESTKLPDTEINWLVDGETVLSETLNSSKVSKILLMMVLKEISNTDSNTNTKSNKALQTALLD